MRNMTPAYLALLACTLLSANSNAVQNDVLAKNTAEHPGAFHFSPGHKIHKIVEHLDLSEEQRQQIKALHEKNEASYQAQHAALRENRKQMHELITSGAFTEDKASELAEDHGEITAELDKLRASEMAQLYVLLTPEQQKKFSNLHSAGPHGKGWRRHKD